MKCHHGHRPPNMEDQTSDTGKSLPPFSLWKMKNEIPPPRASHLQHHEPRLFIRFGIWGEPFLTHAAGAGLIIYHNCRRVKYKLYIYIYMYHIQHGHRSKRAKLLSKIADFYSPLFKQSPINRLAGRPDSFGVLDGMVWAASSAPAVKSLCRPLWKKPQAATESLMCHGCPILPRCCSGIPWYIHEMAIE